MSPPPPVVVGSGYGLTIGLRGPADELDRAKPLLPFWWRDSVADPDFVFDLAPGLPADLVVRSMEHWVAEHAVDVVFVHAAVVSWEGRAVLLPGPSHSGKTTLCVELLRRGATYLSDEYAVLDSSGLVHAYPRVLRVRQGTVVVATTPRSLGAPIADGPEPVVAMAALRHQVDATWSVEELSPARAVLDLLQNAVAARSNPEGALDAARSALASSRCVVGVRGSAHEAAEHVMALVRELPAP